MKSYKRCSVSLMLLSLVLNSCGDDEDDVAFASIKNDFNNPQMDFQPPWTICKSSYLGIEFGSLAPGETSNEHKVVPGLDYVLMVAAWDDPTCSPSASLPIASREEEEIVEGQHRTLSISLPNHQGSCPPEGVAPIPESLYNRILDLWPDFGFQSYANRTQNSQCVR